MPWLSERQIAVMLIARDGQYAEHASLDRRTVKCLIRRGLLEWHEDRTGVLCVTLAGAYYLLGVADGRVHESIRKVRARRAA